MGVTSTGSGQIGCQRPLKIGQRCAVPVTGIRNRDRKRTSGAERGDLLPLSKVQRVRTEAKRSSIGSARSVLRRPCLSVVRAWEDPEPGRTGSSIAG